MVKRKSLRYKKKPRRKQIFKDKQVRLGKRRYKKEKDEELHVLIYRIKTIENFGGKLGQLGLIKPGKMLFLW